MNTQHYWEYFLALEDDLQQTTRFVEFATSNFKTYSIEFARIILAASSEIDVLAKMLCGEISPATAADNITDYRTIILKAYPKLPVMEVKLPRYGISTTPWKNWATGTNPNWWKSYNNVKHQRDQHYHEATLENALDSVAGLLCILLYLFRKTSGKIELIPGTQLLDSTNNTVFMDGSIRWTFKLPDDKP